MEPQLLNERFNISRRSMNYVGVKSLFKKYDGRHCKNKEVVIKLSSRNGNSLVWTEKNNCIPGRRGHTRTAHTKAQITALQKWAYWNQCCSISSCGSNSPSVQRARKVSKYSRISLIQIEPVCTAQRGKGKWLQMGPTKEDLRGWRPPRVNTQTRLWRNGWGDLTVSLTGVRFAFSIFLFSWQSLTAPPKRNTTQTRLYFLIATFFSFLFFW